MINNLPDGGTFDNAPYRTQVITFVTSKQIKPSFHQIFLRTIGFNWLVCLACYLAMQAKGVSSKVMGMWWPIATFVTLGFDHGMPRLSTVLFLYLGWLVYSCRKHVFCPLGVMAWDAGTDSRTLYLER